MSRIVMVAPAAGMAGVVVGVHDIVLTLVAQLEMGSSWRIGVDPRERTALVTGRLFRLTRNPIFSATILTAAGGRPDGNAGMSQHRPVGSRGDARSGRTGIRGHGRAVARARAAARALREVLDSSGDPNTVPMHYYLA